MAWITQTRRKNGEETWWVRDIRDGRQVSIACGSKGEAEMKKQQYVIRKDLEKEGYFDKFADQLFGEKKGV